MMRSIGSNRSRREFLTAAAGVGGVTLLKAADPRVEQVLSKIIGVDMHNHVYPAGTEPHPQRGQPRRQEDKQPPVTLDLAAELKRSDFTAACASFVLDFAQNDKPGDARDNFLRWLTAIDAELEKGHVRRALNMKDLREAHEHGPPVIIQTVEGAHFIERRPERVAEVYERGLRHLQLLHERDDMVSPLGDTNTAVAHLGGLTAIGADVVKECNRLGIVVDLAHASHETVLGALRVATKPVIVSHTSLDSRTGGDPRMVQMMKPRLISKEHAKVVADAGGVVGVWTKMADSLGDFVGSIKSMVDAIGIEHVGIGTDTDLLSARAGQGTNMAWPGMTGGFFEAVVGEMLKQGFTAEDIGKVGSGNFCRVFDQVTAG